jgi:hypothetical protein
MEARLVLSSHFASAKGTSMRVVRAAAGAWSLDARAGSMVRARAASRRP